LNARLVLTEFAVNRQRVVLSPRHRAVLPRHCRARPVPRSRADLLRAWTAAQRPATRHVPRGVTQSRDTRDRRRRGGGRVFHRHVVPALASAGTLREPAAAE
jgi:hypothetical protein